MKANPPILLVLSGASRPRATLHRAQELARKVEARLCIVACLPKASRLNALFPQFNLIDATEGAHEEYQAARRLWRWANRTVVDSVAPEDVVTYRGSVSACATAAARLTKAQLVVLADGDVANGDDVTAIVDGSGVSVLVSRALRPSNTIVAATDLTAPGFPVLKKGAVLAEATGGPLLFVHNIPPDRVPASGNRRERANRVWQAIHDSEKSRTNVLLSAAVGDLSAAATTMVLEEPDTPRAILELARLQRADLVVVGHRRRSRLARLFDAGVAAKLIERSRESVVVVPVDESAAAQADAESRPFGADAGGER